jgi:uncharacterized protein (DUF58 family)
VTWRPTRKVAAYLALVAIGLATGLATARPEPVALAAPLALALALGLGRAPRPDVNIHVEISNPAITEGDEVTLTIELTAAATIPSLELVVLVPDGLHADAKQSQRGFTLYAGRSRRVAVRVQCERWGAYNLGEIRLRARSVLGLREAEGHTTATQPLRVYPRPQTMRRLVRARDTQAATGSQLARLRGSGIEYADMHPFSPGDLVREINWRATARRGVVWVNDRHPNRSTDVVLFLDTFGGPTLADAVRVTDSLATTYLAERDRVGLVTFGGSVQWLRAGAGLRQQYLIVDTLLSTRVFQNVAWKTIGLIPPRVLPAKALVVAVSPLEDERFLAALTDLRGRGIDVVVVEVSPVPYTPPAPGGTGLLAHRIWCLERAATRDEYRALGIPVAEWTAERTLAEVVEEMRAWPRTSRRVG